MHPTRFDKGTLTVADAMRRISDDEMTKMCLCVNTMFGTGQANKLLDLFGAARKVIRDEAAQ